MLDKLLLKLINIAYAQGEGITPVLPNPSRQAIPIGRGGRGGIDFQSPLGGNLQLVIDRVINGLIILATPIVTIMVLWGAFLLITSAGNPEKVKTGRNTILWAAVGYGVLLMARGISFIVSQLLGGVK